MEEDIQSHLAIAAEQWAGTRWAYLPSAAVHDAMFVAQIMRAAISSFPASTASAMTSPRTRATTTSFVAARRWQPP